MKAPSEIGGTNVEEIITSWNAELVRRCIVPRARRGACGVLTRACPLAQERQTRDFGTHARALAEWDRHIFRNRRTLSALETEIKRVAGAQDALERQLSILEVHQHEINDALEGMEREAEKQYKEDGVRDEEAARERDGLFKLAEDVSKQLVDVGAALRETIQMVRRACRAACCLPRCADAACPPVRPHARR